MESTEQARIEKAEVRRAQIIQKAARKLAFSEMEPPFPKAMREILRSDEGLSAEMAKEALQRASRICMRRHEDLESFNFVVTPEIETGEILAWE